MKKVPLSCELPHTGMQEGQRIIHMRIHARDYRERQMSYEFDRSYVEEVIMLSLLTLFLVLAVAIPA